MQGAQRKRALRDAFKAREAVDAAASVMQRNAEGGAQSRFWQSVWLYLMCVPNAQVSHPFPII